MLRIIILWLLLRKPPCFPQCTAGWAFNHITRQRLLKADGLLQGLSHTHKLKNSTDVKWSSLLINSLLTKINMKGAAAWTIAMTKSPSYLHFIYFYPAFIITQGGKHTYRNAGGPQPTMERPSLNNAVIRWVASDFMTIYAMVFKHSQLTLSKASLEGHKWPSITWPRNAAIVKCITRHTNCNQVLVGHCNGCKCKYPSKVTFFRPIVTKNSH